MRRGVRAATCDVKSGARAATCDVSIGVPVTTSPGAAAAFARAGADQFALELGKPAEHHASKPAAEGAAITPAAKRLFTRVPKRERRDSIFLLSF